KLEERRVDNTVVLPDRYKSESTTIQSSFPLASGGFNSLYKGDRKLPGPILTKATITNKGRYGSTRMATVDFTVYTGADLERMTNLFMKPRKKVRLEWGWAQYKNGDPNNGGKYQSTRNGKLTGYVYNFNWNLRSEDGGYNCSFEILGPGSFANGVDANSAPSLAGAVISGDEETQVPVLLAGILGKIQQDVKSVIDNLKIDSSGNVTTTDNSKFGSSCNWQKGSNFRAYTHIPAKLIKPQATGTEQLPSYIEKPNEKNKNIVYISSVSVLNHYSKGDNTEYNDSLSKSDPISALVAEGRYDYYVNLRYIVNVLINTVLISDSFNKTDLESLKIGRSFYFKADHECSISSFPQSYFSADPKRVMIPGKYGDYTTYIGGQGSGVAETGIKADAGACNAELIYNTPVTDSDNNNFIDFSMLLINVIELEKIILKYENEPRFPVTKFLEEIFSLITTSTAGAIKPTMIIPDDIESTGDQSNAVKIIDTNMTEPIEANGNSIKKGTPPIPYNFKAFNKDSIVRSVSMDMKLPNKMATALYIGGNKNITGTTQKVAGFFGLASGDPVQSSSTTPGEAEQEALRAAGLELADIWAFQDASQASQTVQSQRLQTRIYKAGTLSEQEIEELRSDGYFLYQAGRKVKSTGIGRRLLGESSLKDYDPSPRDLNAYNTQLALGTNSVEPIMKSINELGPTDMVIDSAKKVLRKLSQDGPQAAAKPWNKRIVLPINLSVSLDGISGLKFGNLITTNWLPPSYIDTDQDPTISFVITNITQTITAQDWETTLETQCRLNSYKI
ncbi:MAG TPA: hypothetical protein DF712_01680, partial [Balneola sp.]|nr:hypothetical protein [Balneola sp.]